MSATNPPAAFTKPAARRLGRGLSSLMAMADLPVQAEIPAPTPAPALAANTQHAPPPPETRNPKPDNPTPKPETRDPGEIPVDSIRPNPHQPRKTFNDASLAELSASLKSTGLIQPVVVRSVDGGYELIAGQRRLMAAKLAGLSAVPAIVRQVDSVTQAQMALIENIQREDLNPIERAQAYATLMKQLGLTQQELAGRMGEDRSSITHYLRLLELAAPVQAMIRDGRLSLSHAKLIAAVPDVLEQQKLADLCLAQDLTVRNLQRIIEQKPTIPPTQPARPAASPHIQDLEKTIARQLGMKVQVKSSPKRGKGKLIIHYANLDQFDQLLARLSVKTEE